MKKLIVVVNDLEKTAKSSVARSISHYLRQVEVKHLLVTSDEMDMTDSFQGEFWDLEDQFDLSQVISAVEKYEAVVLDVHSGAARIWGEICESEDIENVLAELDTEMTVVIPDNRTERCNEEIADLAELFADQADYVIARLPGTGHSSEVAWKGSLAEKAVRYLGASIIEIPGFSKDLVVALENSEKDFAAALDAPSELPRFAEVAVTSWLEHAEQAISRAQEYLVPDGVSTVALDY